MFTILHSIKPREAREPTAAGIVVDVDVIANEKYLSTLNVCSIGVQ